jgi:hypothetical protein
MSETTIDREAVDAASALFDGAAPADEAYAVADEVTVTLRRGDIYLLRGLVRRGARDYLANVQMVDLFGFEPSEDQVKDTNDTLRAVVRIDEAFAPFADSAEFPRADEDEDEPEVVGL